MLELYLMLFNWMSKGLKNLNLDKGIVLTKHITFDNHIFFLKSLTTYKILKYDFTFFSIFMISNSQLKIKDTILISRFYNNNG